MYLNELRTKLEPLGYQVITNENKMVQVIPNNPLEGLSSYSIGISGEVANKFWMYASVSHEVLNLVYDFASTPLDQRVTQEAYPLVLWASEAPKGGLITDKTISLTKDNFPRIPNVIQLNKETFSNVDKVGILNTQRLINAAIPEFKIETLDLLDFSQDYISENHFSDTCYAITLEQATQLEEASLLPGIDVMSAWYTSKQLAIWLEARDKEWHKSSKSAEWSVLNG